LYKKKNIFLFKKNWNKKSADLIFNTTNKLLDKKKIINFFLTGGKTSLKLYPDLFKHLKSIKKSIKFYLTDERVVGLKSKHSNSRFILEILKKNKIEKKNFFIINKSNNETISKITSDYSKVVQSIDIIILTLGSDGHIASIFNNLPILKKNKLNYFYLKRKNENFYRISLTPKAILNSKKIFVLVYGKKRFNIFKKLKNKSDKFIPASIIYNKAIWLIKK